MDHITYKGKEYPVKIGYRVMKQMKARGVNEDDMEANEIALYHALVSGHKLSDLEMPFKEEDMEDVLDDCFEDFLVLLNKFQDKFKELGLEAPEGNLKKAPKPNRSQRRKQERKT